MKCYGCGQELQSNDESLSGFVSEKILTSKESVLCRRCFKLQNYNTNSEVELVDEDYIKILTSITKKDALLVYVIDIFNFEASMIKDLKKYLSNQKLLVLANKRDVIPSSVKDEKLISWVKERLHKEGLKSVNDVFMISSQTNYNIDLIMDKIETLRNKKDVYIIGNSNVGKSTFINTLLKNYSNETSNFITTSSFPGTTLNVIQIPLDETSFIYDTPGIIANNIMWNAVEPSLIKYLMPKKEVKPLTFNLKSEQSLLIGGLAIFAFVDGDLGSYTCYFSNFVTIMRTKLDKSLSSFDSLIKNKTLKPSSKLINTYQDLIVHEINIEEEGKLDLVIKGYGWISFQGNHQKIILHLPKNVLYFIRKAII